MRIRPYAAVATPLSPMAMRSLPCKRFPARHQAKHHRECYHPDLLLLDDGKRVAPLDKVLSRTKITLLIASLVLTFKALFKTCKANPETCKAIKADAQTRRTAPHMCTDRGPREIVARPRARAHHSDSGWRRHASKDAGVRRPRDHSSVHVHQRPLEGACSKYPEVAPACIMDH